MHIIIQPQTPFAPLMEVNEMLTVYSPEMNVYKVIKTKACTTHEYEYDMNVYKQLTMHYTNTCTTTWNNVNNEYYKQPSTSEHNPFTSFRTPPTLHTTQHTSHNTSHLCTSHLLTPNLHVHFPTSTLHTPHSTLPDPSLPQRCM